MLIIPGGGYGNICSDREGEPIALAYLEKGFNSFVLHYRVGESYDIYPCQLVDAARAVLNIKSNAEKYNINPQRVFTVGFSAGGHLAGSLGLMSHDEELLSILGVKPEEISIRGMVLAYPVVTALTDTHKRSFERLLGVPFEEIPLEVKKKLSLEELVDENSPPAFIWHTATDAEVPAVGSLMLCNKYIEKKVPVSLRIYPYGPHGIALADKFTNYSESGVQIQSLAQSWLSDSVDFINTLK